MNWPQITIAVGLLINFVLVLVAWGRFFLTTRQHRFLPPLGAIYRRQGWLVATIPAIEAWVLHMGGFF